MDIQYKDIVGFPGYRVGNDGTVWSCRIPGKLGKYGQWRMLKMYEGNGGYLRVRLACKYQFRVHRLVLEAFVGPCPNGMEACHNDGDNKNNRLGNLRWDSPSSNQLDKRRHGTDNRGSQHPMASLTIIQVKTIRLKANNGALQKDLQKEFGVSQSCISNIVRMKRWKHL